MHGYSYGSDGSDSGDVERLSGFVSNCNVFLNGKGVTVRRVESGG